MEIILLERIEKLGQMGDVVTVKPGYARNYLLPRGKALRKSADNLARFETQRAQLEADNLARRADAEAIADRVGGMTVAVLRAAGESGQLYGSVTARDIAAAVIENGVTVNRQQIVLDRALKTLGLEQVQVQLHPEVAVAVTVNIARTAEEAARQLKLGHAVGAGDNPDDEEDDARAEAEALFEQDGAAAETSGADEAAEANAAGDATGATAAAEVAAADEADATGTEETAGADDADAAGTGENATTDATEIAEAAATSEADMTGTDAAAGTNEADNAEEAAETDPMNETTEKAAE